MSSNLKTFDGRILESLPAATFRVDVGGGDIVLCYLSGRMRRSYMRILPGDLVRCEIDTRDKTKGRIVQKI